MGWDARAPRERDDENGKMGNQITRGEGGEGTTYARARDARSRRMRDGDRRRATTTTRGGERKGGEARVMKRL